MNPVAAARLMPIVVLVHVVPDERAGDDGEQAAGKPIHAVAPTGIWLYPWSM